MGNCANCEDPTFHEHKLEGRPMRNNLNNLRTDDQENQPKNKNKFA